MKFYVKDCPGSVSIFQWIYDTIDFESAIKDIKNPYEEEQILEIPHKIDIQSLINDTKDAIDNFGIRGWQTTNGQSNAYGGLSIVYNPELVIKVDHNQSTLGTSINTPAQFFYNGIDNYQTIRNTYFDSYAFRKLSPCITETNLKNFIHEFNLSPTRSRIAVLDSNYHDKVGENFLWHRDETIFENLRINIPIDTDSSFMFQLNKNDPINLEIGKLYTWDTNVPHRVYTTKKTEKKRIHLVLGFTPWIDYLDNEDCFIVNDFFGKIHPFDIIFKGLAHPKIGLI
jgi:hypothetical protein